MECAVFVCENKRKTIVASPLVQDDSSSGDMFLAWSATYCL
jgi:hypothetical protein